MDCSIRSGPTFYCNHPEPICTVSDVYFFFQNGLVIKVLGAMLDLRTKCPDSSYVLMWLRRGGCHLIRFCSRGGWSSARESSSFPTKQPYRNLWFNPSHLGTHLRFISSNPPPTASSSSSSFFTSSTTHLRQHQVKFRWQHY